jgi:hypothetical protein
MAPLLLNLVVLGQTAQIIRSFVQESNSMEAWWWCRLGSVPFETPVIPEKAQIRVQQISSDKLAATN